LQRRLVEWGYQDAFLDKDGFYGDQTKSAVEKFQADHGLTVTGLADYETFVAVFENDNNVLVTD
jgi:peptidoglycan hydrolase-like protein with peptidoglycan-binding domain